MKHPESGPPQMVESQGQILQTKNGGNKLESKLRMSESIFLEFSCFCFQDVVFFALALFCCHNYVYIVNSGWIR